MKAQVNEKKSYAYEHCERHESIENERVLLVFVCLHVANKKHEVKY